MFGKAWFTLPLSISACIPLFAWQCRRRYTARCDGDDCEPQWTAAELVHVHIFHRHGQRSPWYPMTGHEDEKATWVPHISKQYSSFTHDQQQSVPSPHIHSWQNIVDKLRGISLAYKHDNWDTNAPKIFDSSTASYESLSAHLTTDNAEHPFLGQLTDKGVAELERVGSHLRNRYVSELQFLPAEYDATDSNLHYHSTNMARTIQSADCVLHTLYPMDTRKHGASIPLHVDRDLTYLNPGRMSRSFCPRLKEKADQNFQHAIDVLSTEHRIEHLTDWVMRHFQVDEVPHRDIDVVFDAMSCRLSHDNTERPHGFETEHLGQLGRYMTKLHTIGMSLDRESLKLFWGNVIFKMLRLMKSEDRRMVVSSCHDNSLLCVLCSVYGSDIHTMHVEWPAYGSFIVFEVWKTADDGKKYVKVLYNGKPLKAFNGQDFVSLQQLEDQW
eukprot:CAMPEP_0202705870 /NCGR_PEP_ID=MMETSP1385-20130828/18375_1 /ASSEMBLY_ACC=CAM_ASM_000861 /TAXON_ID=933848 /ORGANISM="Elphidium margaritaceum" /LENGTH=440 /DNA_ID=CAMNT_0049364211 /DNA_START=8 /DNA_END=1327 /DNA_ORIENTATION=+